MSGSRRLSGHATPPAARLVVAAVLSLSPAAACGGPTQRRQAATDVSVAWSLAPDPPAVGPAILAIRLTDGRRQPIRGARLRAEADMRHPGMKPVLAAATERGNGLYEAELAFTMAGAWVVVVKGELPDGRDLTHQIDLTNVRSGP